MKLKEKKEAIRLRKSGESIGEIAKRLKISKGSVSLWVRDVELTKHQREKLNKNGFSIDVIEKRRKSRINNTQQRKEKIIREAGKDIKSISISELKTIGAMLYWAEGRKKGKQMVSFSNSDPIMIRVMMRFFREVCKVPESKFRGHIHIHSHLQINIAKNYWSDITGISTDQFYKTYSKPSKASKNKKDSLPYGTMDVYVCDTKLFLTIMGWIKKISNLIIN